MVTMSRMKKSDLLDFIADLKRAQEEQPPLDEAALTKAEQPLVRALLKVGLKLESVWDLVNTKDTYPAAVPILLEHLRKPYHRRILEGIARALAVPGARVGWEQLLREYNGIHGNDPGRDVNELKWSLHLALAAAADKSVLDDLIHLACDRRHGGHRSMFVDALARIGGVRAQAALAELRGDPDLKDSFERLDKKLKKRRR